MDDGKKTGIYAPEEYFQLGESARRSIISTNLNGWLRSALAVRNRTVGYIDRQLAFSNTGRYVYLVSSVPCDAPECRDERQLQPVDPVFMVEFLGLTAHEMDKSDKFPMRNGVSSFSEMLFVDSTRVCLENVFDGEKDSFFWPGKAQKPRIALAT